MSDIETLAEDIGFAIFRVSRAMRHRGLAGELEAGAVSLVGRLGGEEAGALLRLVLFAGRAGEITKSNADVLERSINRLRELIHAETAESLGPREAKLPEIIQNYKKDAYARQDSDNKEYAEKQDEQGPKKRRQAIRQFIRQFPDDCRMRDIRLHFPNVSERTLRTDVRRLERQGLLERVGKGGPSSYLVAIEKKNDTDGQDTGRAEAGATSTEHKEYKKDEAGGEPKEASGLALLTERAEREEQEVKAN